METASAGELQRAGLTHERAHELIRVREALSDRSSGLDSKGVERSMRLKVKKWARNTGLAEGLFESLFPPASAEREAGFARPRNTDRLTSRRRLTNESAREVFEAVRRSAIERSGRGIEFLPPGAVNASMRQSMRRLRNTDLQIIESRSVDARTQIDGSVRVTTGLLAEIDAQARSVPPTERPAFRRRALGLILGHELAHVRGNMNEQRADAEAVRTVAGSSLGRIGGVEVPLSEAEVRQTLRVFDRPTRLGRLYQSLRGRRRYGTLAARLQNLIAATREAAAERGLPLPERTGATDRAGERIAERPARETTRAIDRGFDRLREGEAPRGSLGVTGLLEGRTGRAAERGRERDRPRR